MNYKFLVLDSYLSFVAHASLSLVLLSELNSILNRSIPSKIWKQPPKTKQSIQDYEPLGTVKLHDQNHCYLGEFDYLEAH